MHSLKDHCSFGAAKRYFSRETAVDYRRPLESELPIPRELYHRVRHGHPEVLRYSQPSAPPTLLCNRQAATKPTPVAVAKGRMVACKRDGGRAYVKLIPEAPSHTRRCPVRLRSVRWDAPTVMPQRLTHGEKATNKSSGAVEAHGTVHCRRRGVINLGRVGTEGTTKPCSGR
ncbi:unnamed protein product [Trypanosoma congolense IL3000]|uniref:WGS project CAEQ00000000 data, annotated contig 2092 n=1 Tax=Trypanosoma congolense (strain IL3000) TaxID=1068625 RepID=F9WBD8_TRYCI|nr:unnamed protein product [Trypanosoma congolense IL3000]